MQNLPLLIDLISEAYDNPFYRPRGKKTYCNHAVKYIASGMGYEGFQNGKWPYLANEIIDIMARDSLWRKTGLVFAQNKANQGYLSVAGEKKKPHGHVCVIRPGNFVYSQKWGYYCPKVMNIGSKNFMGLGLNYAFKKIPEIWVFQG